MFTYNDLCFILTFKILIFFKSLQYNLFYFSNCPKLMGWVRLLFANVFLLYPVQCFALFILVSDNEKIWEGRSNEAIIVEKENFPDFYFYFYF